jgi:LCP family protein required for cell wall assembly
LAKHIDPQAQKRSKSPVLKRVLLSIGIAIVGFIAVVAGFSIGQHKNPLQVVLEPVVPTPQQVFGKNHLLVLVVGLDYDYNNKDEEYSSQSRSDVIKAVNIDFDNKQAYVLDVGRDMVATLPNGERAKINEAQSDGGIKESRKVVAQFLGIPKFDRYVILRADSMKDIINAIGGITIDVKDSDCISSGACKNQSPLNYTDTWGHLYIHLKPGVQHLNGAQAVGYARYRHDWCGDPCRMKRQDQVVGAMVQKIKGNKLNTLLHANDLIKVIQRNVTTDLTEGEMVALADYFLDFSTSDLHTAQLGWTPVTLPDGGDATLVDPTDLATKVRTMLIAPPTPLPSPDALALASISPGTVHVDVENGSGVRGAAHRVAEALQKQGFIIDDVGDASSSDVATTEVQQHSSVNYVGARVRESLPSAAQEAPIVSAAVPATPHSDVTVIVGKDIASPVPPVTP